MIWPTGPQAGVVESAEGSRARVRLNGFDLVWVASGVAAMRVGDRVQLCIRPEGLSLVSDREAALDGTIEERRFLGAASLYTVRLGEGRSLLEVSAEPGLERGAPVGVALRPGADLPIAFVAP